MRDLKTLREVGEAMNQAEAELPCDQTIEESVRDFLSLCQAFAPFIEETKDLFRPDREAYLTELQARLRQLNESRPNGQPEKSA